MPGVTQKPLGTFTERQCAAIAASNCAGRTYRAGARSVYLVLSGSGIAQRRSLSAVDGAARRRRRDVDIVARDDTELLRLVLPDLTGIKERRAAHAVAAE